jgi:hypothetical protein
MKWTQLLPFVDDVWDVLFVLIRALGKRSLGGGKITSEEWSEIKAVALSKLGLILDEIAESRGFDVSRFDATNR